MSTGVSFTHFGGQAVLNRVFRNNAGSPTFPTTVYVALFTADPGEGGTQTSEISVSGYTRQAITFGAPVPQTFGDLITDTSGENFGTPATTNGQTAAFIGLLDSATLGGGNMWARGALDNNVIITAGVPLIDPVGGITFLLD